MAVCKYFLDGCCRYGDRCKFKHIYVDPRENYFGNEDQNFKPRNSNSKGFSSGVSILRANSTFNPYGNTNSSYNNSNYNTDSSFGSSNYNSNSNGNQRTYSTNQSQDLLPVILKDLEVIEGGNQWPLTCFCPLKDITGNAPGWIDHSPEELRWEVYKSIKDGNFEQCKNTIQQLFKEAQERRNDFKTREKAIAIIDRMIQEKQLANSSVISASNVFQSVGHIDGASTPQSAFMTSVSPTVQSSFTQSGVVPSVSQSGVFQDPAPAFSFSLNQGSVGNVTNYTSNIVTDSSQIFPNTNPPSSNQVIFNPNPSSVILDGNENTIYSNLSELTENELCSFQANTFKFGQVPLKPPPKELCYNVNNSHM
ncbi:nucleoporin NUP42-like [Lycorma delicatula]|uniref:nucleoporin NUP42-like n=1 Tax=Lycorma delicatula TaxID=130591 RepID=UPI003F50DDDC